MSRSTSIAPTRTTKPLSVLDMAFFMLETCERMSNVGPLAILQPPPRTRSPRAFADRLMKQLKARPVGAPFNLRYRPAGLQGLPCLETVDAVDLDAHCHRLTLPGPGTDAQLFEAVCRLHEKRLDRSRPPWEFYLFDGLERGRVAIYAKVHHGLIDGRGFVEVCTRWFSSDAADLQVRALWEGLPLRKARAGAARQATAGSAFAGLLARTARSAASLWSALARQALASAKVLPGMSLPFVGTSSVLRAKPSMRRSFAYCVLPIAQMKSFGKAHAASVNDVLLTVLDMALHRYLDEKGRSSGDHPLVVDMPVALGQGAGGGNGIAVLQLPLGAAAASPIERLKQICRRTAHVKTHVRRTNASALVTYTAAVHGVPALLETLRFERGPMLANMMVSNPFGLPERRYLAGAEIEIALPVSVLAPGQSLNVTAVTYDQGLQLGFIAIAAQVPDVQRLADFMREAFVSLTLPAGATKPAAAGEAPIPEPRSPSASKMADRQVSRRNKT